MNNQKESSGIRRIAGITVIIIAAVIGALLLGFAAHKNLGGPENRETPGDLYKLRDPYNRIDRRPMESGKIVSTEYERALKIEDESERLAALLYSADKANSGGRTVLSGRVYLGHLYYQRGETEAADVYLSGGEKRENTAGVKPLSEGEGVYSGDMEPLAKLLSHFHEGRRAFVEGDYEEAVLRLDKGFFTLIDSSLFEHAEFRGGRVIHEVESEASDFLAASFSTMGKSFRALQVYRRLWERRSVEMREDRFISYALLLSEIIEGPRGETNTEPGIDTNSEPGIDTKTEPGGLSHKDVKEELRSILEEWSFSRAFRPQSAPVFMELYEAADQISCGLLAGAEQIEYLRPAFNDELYSDAIDGLVSSLPDGTAATDIGRVVSFHARGEWNNMEEALDTLREHKKSDEFRGHRFFRYLSASAAMHIREETGTFAELEPLFSEFQMYYLRLAEGALAAEPRREQLAAAALRAGILAAPDTDTALEARDLLWSLEGPESGSDSTSGAPSGDEPASTSPYPLLEEELEKIAEFIRLGASPVLLDPVVEMLRYSDNIFSLQAELIIRRVRERGRVQDYLARRFGEAEGRLRERLGSILRK
ncbi:MAG: hypothetical protein R6V67_05980 [Spirochaetia bacterium]